LLYHAKLTEMASGKGLPRDATTTYGTVADQAQYDRVTSIIEQGRKEATVAFGGNAKADQVRVSPGSAVAALNYR